MSKHIHKELNQLGRHFTAILHEKLKIAFADNPNMLKQIEAHEKDTTFNYDVISEKPDFDRAHKIAKHEAELEMLGDERVADILVEVCLIPKQTASFIAKTQWEKHFLES